MPRFLNEDTALCCVFAPIQLRDFNIIIPIEDISEGSKKWNASVDENDIIQKINNVF